MTNPVMDVLLAGVGLVGWVAICAGVNAWLRPAPAAPVDPCAESRAASSALRAECRALPAGESR
ncbi:hypothetical protein [Streptomyces sp. DASNCL29]|uniref:hypothetical protein n=1 Tax=Streptomyces sp. DASNCL29 TaxID=2583819 RepID=UPI00110F8926|nr:hypothetical protein [Streptomyces sp. DASNCL29]TMU98056.1 hypothetical protein FGK60_09475 [Streptomyces sp. DASNCL29]